MNGTPRENWRGRLWRWARVGADWVPVTPLGLLALPLLIWLLIGHGIGSQDRILFALTIGGLALVGVSLLAVLLTCLCLGLRRHDPAGPALELEAGVPVRTGYWVRFPGWLPFVKVEWTWDEPGGVRVRAVSSGCRLVEEVTADERAAREQIVRRFVVTDVFGLARWAFRRRAKQPVKVAPSPGHINALNILPQYDRGDGLAHPEGKPEGDWIETRTYAPGDPLKRVLWKTYARTGRLLVRTPERAVKPCERSMAYLVGARADEPAAGIARAVLEGGALGKDFLFAAEGAESPTQNAREAVEQVIASANARDQAGAGLGGLLDRGEAHGLQACILFVPAEPGPWLERVAEQVARRPGPFRAIIGVDGIRSAARPSAVRRLFLSTEPVPGSSPDHVRAVCARLAAAGAEVSVVNRASGEATVGG